MVGKTTIFEDVAARAEWMVDNILPLEPALRRQLARWRLPDGLDIDDVVQEAYANLAVVADLDKIVAPRPYLFRTAYMIILGHIRRQRVVSIETVADVEQFGLTADQPSPEGQAVQNDNRERLQRAIARLDPLSRSVFQWRIIDELPFKDIAKRLGISAKAAQKHLARTINRLMIMIEQGGNGGVRASKQMDPGFGQGGDERKVGK